MTESIEQPVTTPSEELSLDTTRPEDISPTALVANAHMPTESDVTHIRKRQGASIADVAARMTKQHHSKGKGSSLLLKLCDRVIKEQAEKNDSLRWENLVSMHNQIGQYLANASLITYFIRNRTLMRCVGDKPRLERLVSALARDLVTIKKRTMANADAYPIKSGVVSDDQMIPAIGIYENYEAILLDLVDVVLPNYHEAMEIITLAERTVLDLEATIIQAEAGASIIPDSAPADVVADLCRGLDQPVTVYPGEALESPTNAVQGECLGGPLPGEKVDWAQAGSVPVYLPHADHSVPAVMGTTDATIAQGECVDGFTVEEAPVTKFARGENPFIARMDDAAFVSAEPMQFDQGADFASSQRTGTVINAAPTDIPCSISGSMPAVDVTYENSDATSIPQQ